MSVVLTFADVCSRARRHAIRTSRTASPWGPALRLTPCPCCGEGSAIAEHDGFGVLAYCRCGGDVAARLIAEPGPDPEATIDLLLDIVIALVLASGRIESSP